jgi:hypothetical protein
VGEDKKKKRKKKKEKRKNINMPYNKLRYKVKFKLNQLRVNKVKKDQKVKKDYDNLKL